jgi:hypothetical protein
MDTTTAPETFPTREHLTALSMVGRVVTDGAQVGVVRMIDGPDWVVATNGDGSEARLVHVEPVTWTAPGPVAQVRWHGTEYLATVPMDHLTRGVTMFKAYGLH